VIPGRRRLRPDRAKEAAIGSDSAETPLAARAQPIVRLTDITKQYGDHAAVDAVTLQVDQGNVLAIVRPPDRPRKDGDLEKAPITRSVVMIAIGAVACTWALASLVVG